MKNFGCLGDFIGKNGFRKIEDLPVGHDTLGNLYKIEKINFEGKDCYKLEINSELEKRYNELYYIDRETNFPIFCENNEGKYKINISLNSVKDEDIELPNMEEYNIINLNE